MAGLASMIQGVSRRRAPLAGFVIFPVLVLVLPLAGCTGSSGSPRAAGSPAATQRGPASATPAASVCTATQIKAAIGHFFGDWNHSDAAALGSLFTADGDLDMATKDQDTLASGAWDSAGGGPGARGMIAAVAARFADGTVQPMNEAKFHYDCQSQAFFHVVIISAQAARQA